MIDVLKRLSELDAGNPNVDTKALIQSKPMATVTNMDIVREGDAKLPQFVEPDLVDLRKLSGVKLDECGMMPSSSPASLNVTAGSGQELSGILKDLMGLAGMGKPEPAAVLTATPDIKEPQSGGDVMRGMMDKLNGADDKPEDEGLVGGTLGAIGGGMLGGPLGAMAGYAAGSKAGDDISSEDEGQSDSGSPVAAMADEVRDMADELADTDKEEIGLESYDNTPASPVAIPPSQEGAHEYNPNKGDHRERQAGLARAMPESLEDRLMYELRSFMAEGSTK